MVDASTIRYVKHPEILDWCTSEYATKHCPAGVGNDDSHENPAHELEPLRGENAAILEQDRCFRQTEREIVHNKACPKRLERVSVAKCLRALRVYLQGFGQRLHWDVVTVHSHAPFRLCDGFSDLRKG